MVTFSDGDRIVSTAKKGTPEEIVQRSMKGWTPVTKPKSNMDGTGGARESDAEMPSTETLKKKWFGPDAHADAAAETPSVDDQGTANVSVKSGSLEKLVGVAKGKILWRQG